MTADLIDQLVRALESALPVIEAQVNLMADKEGALVYEIPLGVLGTIKAALAAAYDAPTRRSGNSYPLTSAPKNKPNGTTGKPGSK